jgi:hypothetical protein
MSIRNLLYLSYWFKQPVIATRSVYLVWLFGLLVMVAVGIACYVWRRYAATKILNGVLEKIGNLASTMGITGLVFFFFRQQSVPFLGWRFWFLLWGIIVIAWAGRIIKYIVKRVPEIKAEQEAKARKEKYLPAAK